jgi:hypothetical protein
MQFLSIYRLAISVALAPAVAGVLFATQALGQQAAAGPVPEKAPAAAATPPSTPVFEGYKGVRLGMAAEEVRSTLGKPSEKDKVQDFFEVSDHERARVYYDGDGKANAIVVVYRGAGSGAPDPRTVFGVDVPPGADGSISKMVAYPEAGYWIAYTRSAGDEPMVVVTMQKTNKPTH